MADNFVGEIRIFGCNFAPSGWAQCAGQLLPISQNTALFSLLGTYYGGDGRSTFGLPNLQGNAAMNYGNGPGLSPYGIGQSGGSATVTLLQTQIPSHTHAFGADAASGRVSTPSTSTYLSASERGQAPVYSSSQNGSMAVAAVSNTGGSGAHDNMMPYVVMNFCIALTGIFPPRS